jgi:hypothetical protein
LKLPCGNKPTALQSLTGMGRCKPYTCTYGLTDLDRDMSTGTSSRSQRLATGFQLFISDDHILMSARRFLFPIFNADASVTLMQKLKMICRDKDAIHIRSQRGIERLPRAWCGMTGNESQLQAFYPNLCWLRKRDTRSIFAVLYLTRCCKDSGSQRPAVAWSKSGR